MAASKTPQTPKATLIQAILEVEKGLPTWSVLEQVFPDFAAKYAIVNGTTGFNIIRIGIKSSLVDGVQATGDLNHYYISLRDFCRIVNTVLLVDQNNKPVVKINTATRPAGDNTSALPTSKYRTFKYHTSSDPGVCILPNTNGWPISDFAKNTVASYVEGDPTEILNIFVNFNVLERHLKALVDSSKEQRTVYNLFDPIFASLNDAMGGINQLGFHYEESEQTFYIVDRQVQVEKKEDIPILNITGLKSSVTQFDFTTKLSPAIATMVAVSAQASGEDVGLEAEALFKWNEGLTDRITTKRKQNITKSTANAAEKEAAKKEALKQQQGRIDGITKILNTIWKDKIYNSEDVKNAVIQYQAYAAYFLQSYKDSEKTAGPAGIIPFEVMIEMDGISGIKIGQAFQINEGIMPNKYYGTIGFIVTGVEHTIANNRWITKLKAQTIVLEGAASKTIAPDQKVNPITGENSEEVNGVDSLATYAPTSNTVVSTNPALDKLKNQIAYHESANSYAIANIGGSSIRSNVNVNGINIGHLLKLASLPEYKGSKPDRKPNKDRVFAAGRYQIINNPKGGTLQAALKGAGLTSKDFFTAENQEKLGDWLLLEQSPAIGNYIKGTNKGEATHLAAALNKIGYVWASAPVVKKSNGTVVGDIETGIGNVANYGGSGANPAKARYSVATLANLLIYTRKQYTGKSPAFVPKYYNLG
jgi:hypothetical protein